MYINMLEVENNYIMRMRVHDAICFRWALFRVLCVAPRSFVIESAQLSWFIVLHHVHLSLPERTYE